MTQLETRALRVRSVDTEKRTIAGIAVPWDEVTSIGGYYNEVFERGSIELPTPPEPGVKFRDLHGRTVGTVPVTADTDAGFEIEARIANTRDGDDVLALATPDETGEAAYGHLSIGFEPVEHRIEVDENGVETVTRTRVIVREVSAADWPAYTGATITEVRTSATQKETPMPPTPTVEDSKTEERTGLTDLERRLAVLEDSRDDTPAGPAIKYRSLGEFAKALATGEADADDAKLLTRAYAEAMETRAYEGATLTESVVKAPFINRDVKLVQNNRPIFNLFSAEALPSTGMSIEYPTFGTVTGSVATQAAEGDDLAYIELDVATDSATVTTRGAYSLLSKQVIERSSIPYVNKVLAAQAISYGKNTNAAVRTTLTGMTGTNTGTLAFADKGKGAAWTDVALGASADIETNSYGLAAEFWIMGLTHFRQLAAIVDSAGRPVFTINGDGANTFGDVNVRGLRGNVAGMPVILDPGMTGNYSYIASSEAITRHESGPFNLDDEGIVNLTKAFSIYGYIAVAKNDAKGVVKVNHPTS